MQAALPHLPMLYRLLVVLVALAAVAAEPDPCLDHDYATENYATCCAGGGYKKEGHTEVCKVVGPKVKGKKEL
eukprot:scaffold197959_cov31-Tisochrysis_lutea.AAC.1